MKSFKEFLMENEEGQNSGNYNSETLNDFFNNFLKSFNNNSSVENIEEEKIVKYLICVNLGLQRNFEIKGNDNDNENLQNLRKECKNIFYTTNKNGNQSRSNKFKPINEYIRKKYYNKINNFYLPVSKIKQDLSFDDFLKVMGEKIEEKLKKAKNNPPSPPTNGGNGGNPPSTNGGNGGNGNNGGNNENYGTTRQGSYLGRFTSAQMEDIMSGNEDKITNALGVMAKAAKDRCDELLSQVKEKVEKNSKYLKEEEIAQKVLWENIFNRLPKQTKLKVQKQHGAESIYKDKGNQKLTEIINNYKVQIDNLVKTTVDNCLPLGKKLHSFSTSAKMEEKLEEQIRLNVRNFTNKLYDITLEVEKASRKSGFFENKKIEKGSKKEEEWNNFKNSEKGENFNRRLSEKTEAIKKELQKILPNIQKASNEAEVNIKLVSKLIKDSTSANDFFVKASTYKKVIENGKKISILDWLQKRGIPIPINKEINDKYSKDLTVASWNELFKDKAFLNSLNGYGEDWDDFKVARDNIRTLEDFEKVKEQFGKDFGAEINVFCKEFVELEKQKQKGNSEISNNSDTSETSNTSETSSNSETSETKKSVTTNSCDGLPIGARKYSKAVRRRMNHALNKYL